MHIGGLERPHHAVRMEEVGNNLFGGLCEEWGENCWPEPFEATASRKRDDPRIFRGSGD